MIEIEIKKPFMWIDRGVMISINPDGTFSSILYRRKGWFKKVEILNDSFSNVLLEEIFLIIDDAKERKNKVMRTTLPNHLHLPLIESALDYIISLVEKKRYY